MGLACLVIIHGMKDELLEFMICDNLNGTAFQAEIRAFRSYDDSVSPIASFFMSRTPVTSILFFADRGFCRAAK